MIPDSWYDDGREPFIMPANRYEMGVAMFEMWKAEVLAHGMHAVLKKTGWRLNQVGVAEMGYPTDAVQAWYHAAVSEIAPMMVQQYAESDSAHIFCFKGVGICGSVWFDHTFTCANIQKKARVSLVAICNEKRELQRVDILIDPTFDETWA